jgi:hypothetical protein
MARHGARAHVCRLKVDSSVEAEIRAFPFLLESTAAIRLGEDGLNV